MVAFDVSSGRDTHSSVSCDEGSCRKKILKPEATEASIQNGSAGLCSF